MSHDEAAAGRPGLPPTWTSSRKSGVGTAASDASPLWFTLSNGIVNEVYFPSMDRANTRDIGFLVASGPDFFSEEKRDTRHDLEPVEQGVPGYVVTNTCKAGRYRIRKEIITDPRRAVLLMRVHFEALRGRLEELRWYLLVAPHLINQGANNNAWIEEWKGVRMLHAARAGVTLSVACSSGWKTASVGYVGRSDGWQQVREHGRLVSCSERAPGGNVALTGEIDAAACGGSCVVAVGFGLDAAEAGHHARAGLLEDFDAVRHAYVQGWREYQRRCESLVGPSRDAFDVYRVSMAVLRTHESKRFPGGIIASLSIPWGEKRGDHDLGGYHVVWPRDMMHAGFAQLAAGRAEGARQGLLYLMCTQEASGRWPQTMWTDGSVMRGANQSDQTAAFLLLAGALRRRGALGTLDPWPAARRAAEFLIQRGAVTQQDRWEENAGYTTYTLATMIAGLLIAAELGDDRGDAAFARQCRDTADDWNGSIERWLYATDSELARTCGVEGFYVRIAPPGTRQPGDLSRLNVWLRNHAPGEGCHKAAELVSPDALALVRFGLRRPDDPRIRNTVAVIDATLKRETRAGPVWRRFTDDGYGEGADGEPFTGVGIGRGWPLLTGERAHYELAAGRRDEAERLLHALVAMSHQGGLLSEQIWDDADMPEKGLFNGQPSGSAAPLVWAHAELVTLLRSLRDGEVFDCPPETVARYLR